MSLLKVRADVVPVAVVLMVFGLQLWACTLPLAWSAVVGFVLVFFSSILMNHHRLPKEK